MKIKHSSRKSMLVLSIICFVLSILFYVISLYMPVSKDITLATDIDVGPRLHDGMDLLFEGWEGFFFMKIPAWFANITYVIAIIFSWGRQTLIIALIFAFITLILGLTALLLPIGLYNYGKVVYLSGFYWWISSFIFLIICILFNMAKKTNK